MKVIGITCSINAKKVYLNRDYIRKIVSLGFFPLLITPDMLIFKEQIVNNVSALIISGGEDINPQFYGEKNVACRNIILDERVKSEIELLDAFLLTQKPVLGICYGMQLMNIFLGGSLFQNIKSSINHRKSNHEVEILADFPLKRGKFPVNSSHHQAVNRLGKGLEVFCKAEDEIVEGFYLKGHPFFVGVQWHPERDSGEASLNLWKIFVKKIQ
ncbi:MAG: type 1 glutamine amidotransferase [Thermodesulfovibrio sp.]|nr:type 1 glutamine amidotransferase [Thermodesulfovibrio sp.]